MLNKVSPAAYFCASSPSLGSADMSRAASSIAEALQRRDRGGLWSLRLRDYHLEGTLLKITTTCYICYNLFQFKQGGPSSSRLM